jgi:succinate-semialdehyde dehydrogenase/glutarate-semialdehyde dehydrogenase
VYAAFVDMLAARAAALVVADGLINEQADVGSMATRAGVDKVERHVADARKHGARVLCGGGRTGDSKGLFYAPTVLADCPQQMLVMHEETFGPVVGVAPFATLDEAIELANGTPAGLAAYAYTEDLRETFEIGRGLEFGSVAINNVDAGIMNAPYGGRKQSGIGYEHGHEGLEGYLHLKHLRVHHGA